MRSSFFGFQVASQGLYTSKTSLDIVNHNIANAATPGYSRQIGNQKATRPLAGNNGKGMLGTGSEIIGIHNIRDSYLDTKYWRESTYLGEYQAKKGQLDQLEALFNEPSDSGFNTVFNDFYTTLENLNNSPGNEAYRNGVKEAAVSLARYFNSTASRLERQQQDLNFAVKTTVEEINSLGHQIQNLNRQIYGLELDGSLANDLRDERLYLVDQLSKLIDTSVEEITGTNNQKEFIVRINGQPLVNHFSVQPLTIKPRADLKNPEDLPDLYDVYFSNGTKLDASHPSFRGELRGYIDLRDGSNTNGEYKGVPYYIAKLDEFVQTFAKAFNGVHKAEGDYKTYDKDGNLGGNFFAYIDATGKEVEIDFTVTDETDPKHYKNMKASNFKVADAILADVKKIALSSRPGEESNTEILHALLALKRDNTMFELGEPGNYMEALISTLGIDSKEAQLFEKNQSNLVKAVNNQRMSISGVDLNEEVAYMMKYLQIYNASARMMTVIDQIYDTTINRMGV